MPLLKPFTTNSRISASRRVFMLALLLFAVQVSLPAQETGTLEIRYFVSPEYPALARRTLISGDVILRIRVAPPGNVEEISALKSPHKLLEESAMANVFKWKFNSHDAMRTRTVVFHYGFSGSPREREPRTIVTVDFLTPQVFVLVDPPPPLVGDGEFQRVPKSGEKPQKTKEQK